MSDVIGSASIEIEPETGSFGRKLGNDSSIRRGAEKAGRSAGQAYTNAFERSTRSVAKIATGTFLGIGAASVARSAAGIVRSIATIGIAYQDQLNTFQSVSGATNKQLQSVDKTAIALGNDLSLPNTSAADVAQSLVELAKAGLDVADSQAAVKGAIQLSIAGQLDAAQAAQVTANTLNAFALTGKNAARNATQIANELANAANVSSGAVGDFAVGLGNSSAVAHQFGLSVGSTLAPLAELANNGVDASSAGTQLRGILIKLEAPTLKQTDALVQLGTKTRDSNGHLLSLVDIVGQLQKGYEKLGPAARDKALKNLFGAYDITAGTILVKGGSKALTDYQKKIEAAGGAARVAAALSKGLGGALRGVQSEFETFDIQVYDQVEPGLERLTRQFADEVPAAGRKVIGFLVQAKPVVANFFKEFENGTGTGGKVRDLFGEIRDTGEQVGRVLTGSILPAAEDLAKDALPLLNDGLKTVKPVFQFIADHPDVFKQIAKDAVIIGVALKGRSILQGLSGQAAGLKGLLGRGGAGLLGRGGAGGGVELGARGSSPANPLYVVAEGAIGGGSGVVEGGSAVGRRGISRLGVGGGLVGGVIAGSTGNLDNTSNAISTIASGAIAGSAFGPEGAIAGGVAAAVVAGFRQGSRDAAADKKTFAAFNKQVASTTAAFRTGGVRNDDVNGTKALAELDKNTQAALNNTHKFEDMVKILKRSAEEADQIKAIAAASTQVNYLIDQNVKGSGRYKAQLTAALAGLGFTAKQVGTETGQALAEGIIKGIEDRELSVKARAGQLGAVAANAARHGAEVFSPSRITVKAGQGIADGFSVGMANGTNAQIRAGAALGKATATAAGKAAEKAVEATLNGIETKLSSISDLRSSASGVALSGINITSLTGKNGLSPSTTAGLLTVLTQKVVAEKAFNRNLVTARKRGVSKDLIRQLAEAGPDAAGSLAAQLAGAPGAQIRQLNALEAQGIGTAAAIGRNAVTGVFGAGAEASLLRQQAAANAHLAVIQKYLQELPARVGVAVADALNSGTRTAQSRGRTAPPASRARTP